MTSLASSVVDNNSSQLARPDVVALFISDLHLQSEMPATTEAFLRFLSSAALHAKQLYLLGDIFEYWAGDDDLESTFPQKIAHALREVSNAGVAVFWIAGNRDFLVGDVFARATNITLLPDPYLFEHAGKRYLISHGDQFCTDDLAYQQFRTQVRKPEWQAAFLSKPLVERKAIIAGMRQQSQQHQRKQMQQSTMIMDVNPDAIIAQLNQHQADVLIHGHTHRPALHQYGQKLRYVLSDWDRDSDQAKAWRGDWLALLEDGSLQRYDALGAPVAEKNALIS
jgi:UDP-2,3-diacylglucosamine hydrolase